MLRKKPGLVPQQGQIYHKEKKQALFFPLPFLHLYWPQIGWCWQCLSDLLEDQSGEEKCLGVKKRSTAPLEHLIPVGATLWSQQAPKAQPKAPPTWLPRGCFGLGCSWTGFTGWHTATEAGRDICEYADLVSKLARCSVSYALPGSCLRPTQSWIRLQPVRPVASVQREGQVAVMAQSRHAEA